MVGQWRTVVGQWRTGPPRKLRLLWLVIHYNRKKLRMISKQALLDGISPSEVGSNEVVLAS